MKLYLVPTPIGNLEDITLRAIRVLGEVDAILAEDTRTSGTLLKHLNISKPLYAHHAHNEHAGVAGIVKLLKEGKSLALISDAGTPGISDPGFLLVKACVEQGIEVETLPGATAVIPALVNSGFPIDRFVFLYLLIMACWSPSFLISSLASLVALASRLVPSIARRIGAMIRSCADRTTESFNSRSLIAAPGKWKRGVLGAQWRSISTPDHFATRARKKI